MDRECPLCLVELEEKLGAQVSGPFSNRKHGNKFVQNPRKQSAPDAGTRGCCRRIGGAMSVCVWGGQGLTGEVKERGLLYLRTFLDKEKGKLPASEIKQEDFLKKDKPF